MHDCASILDSIAKGISLFQQFSAWCIPSQHPHAFIFALYYFCWFVYKCSYAHAHAYSTCCALIMCYIVGVEIVAIHYIGS